MYKVYIYTHTHTHTHVPTIKKKLGSAQCESGNVEVHWNNIRKCVPNTVSVFIGKVDR